MFVQHRNFGKDVTLRCAYIKSQHNSGEHLHQFFEIDIIFSGEIEVTLNGKTAKASAGDIIFIPSFAKHSFCTPDSVKMQICVFSGAFIDGLFSEKMLITPRLTPVFHPSDAVWRFLSESGFTRMWGHYLYDAERDTSELAYISSIFRIITAEYFATIPPSENASYDGALPKVLSYMSEHYTKNISLKTVGAALGYSPKYISNCLSVLPNTSFRGLLNSMRIERAKELLRSSNLNNYEVATASGFNSECTFHRVFLAQEGCTPNKYRQSAKNQ